MNQPPPSPQELDRLANLAYYDILDSLPEQEYDDITLLAAQICQTPISLITFVDQDRQWFKSHFGILQQQTPRDLSFCAHAILDPQQMMVVPDATQDERFAHNPLTKSDPHVIFYAGVPLVTQEGHALGTLCVIDSKPSSLSPTQVEALSALARQVMALLVLRKKTIELQQAREKERELLVLKSKFVSMVSHEFRTPLTTIATSTDLIKLYLEQLPGGALSPVQRHVGIIANQINRFSELLDGVLTFSQGEAGKIAFRPQGVNLVALCQEVIGEHFSARPDQRRVQLRIEGPPTEIEADARLMAHTVINLLSNAFKFSERDPGLVLRFEPAQLVLLVTDEGIGIPQEEIPNLFDSFYRASNATLIEGTGLGLSITRQFVELHGGSLQVESQENQGTTFSVGIPYQQRLT